ncbi:THO complex subunit 1 [Hyphodiscus hymeniophilus]|uniref:guanylate kinase n=1 Tax=Hyphodiscus hymeniophilus TaxID=353542 RepID=A0A9P6VIR2_9HELO|nr:THO complex subunit 1 [Hyphodiscus hymeniophilus]
MAGHGVQGVDEFRSLLQEMLQRAEVVKSSTTVEPAVTKSDLGNLLERVEDEFFSTATTTESSKKRKHAVIETAVRETFNSILANTTIEMPAFVQLWNLLDIISILSDDEQCDAALLFWLIEELLDSQTIAGCRKIFDFLESRREKITAKHFSQKNLVILRSCNELLRRLSRAEDTAFCGRVFIFMFQSFPLGDKSSVNLRGEYHTENVTTFDKLPLKEADPEEMDVDADSKAPPAETTNNTAVKPAEESGSGSKGVTFSRVEPMSVDELYPKFWSLQESFNQPKKLFDASNFAGFRAGLEATMTKFKSVQTEANSRPIKASEEGKRGTKRKRSQGEDDLANAFNPKYLTSRDLFELEISDLSFRRHILVQALIVMDFLLSLSTKAKEKLAKAMPEGVNSNKSVVYADQTLSDDETKWALDMKRSVAEYLRQGFEGPFFYRMVETVLSRDKNWVRWKVENCPSIARIPISPEDYVAAKSSARKATTNKRLRPNPLGSVDLKFLAELEGRSGLERLKDPAKYKVPSVKSFQTKIEMEDMDIEMGRDDESKNAAIERKASATWRALRIACGTKLVAFDKIDKDDQIDAIFQDHAKTEEPATNGDDDVDESLFPKDRRPIVISGPSSGVGKGTLITMLMGKHAKVLGKKASHTTRTPREGEVHGQHYYFVTQAEYNVLRDGDQFLELNNFNGNDYGTSRKVVESIIAHGKVPIMEMDMHGIQQLKDASYAARFLFLQPPNIAELSERLRRRGSDDEDKIKARLEIAEKELQQAKVEGFHDKIFVNDDLQKTYEKLEKYIFGLEGDIAEEGVIEVEMPEAPAGDVIMNGGSVAAADGPVEERPSAAEIESSK